MDKLSLIVVVFLYLTPSLYSSESIIANLMQITSNTEQKFIKNNYIFTCTPYGIITLEQIYKNENTSSECKSAMELLYKRNPNYLSLAQRKFSLYQSYNIRIKERECIISLNGMKSLSEILIEEGLAIKKRKKLDGEYNYYFLKAQKKSRYLKKGIWKDSSLKYCDKYIEN